MMGKRVLSFLLIPYYVVAIYTEDLFVEAESFHLSEWTLWARC